MASPAPEQRLHLTSTTLGRFCRELACGLDKVEVLLTEWGVTPDEFEQVKRSPAFIAEMQVVQGEMQALGADAGYIYRMKSLCEDMLPDFISLYRDPVTSIGQKFEMIKWAAEMARLKDKPVSRGTEIDVKPRGPQVVFHFGAGLPIQSMTVIAEEAGGVDVGPGPNFISSTPSPTPLRPIAGGTSLSPAVPIPVQTGSAPNDALEGFM